MGKGVNYPAPQPVPEVPAAPPPPPPPPPPPTPTPQSEQQQARDPSKREAPRPVDAGQQQTRATEKRQATLRAGRTGTILTSGQGVLDGGNTAKKTLLGQGG
jgi:outer membrane biosynthesis protein TonB